MNEETGEVRPTDEIREEDLHKYSEPFKKNEIGKVKGLNFRITRWSKGRLFLKLVRKNKEVEPPNPIPLPKGQEGFLCPDCGTRMEDSPDGPWCPKCHPDAPRKFHVEECGPFPETGPLTPEEEAE